jgi:hypothetical protein
MLSSWNESLSSESCGAAGGQPISPHWRQSSFLRIPNLKNNSFSYSIPRELDRLSRLQQLAWGNNTFISDEIPVNIFFFIIIINVGV